ncbi:MAG: hypothetical protein ACAI35_04180 [Candidatus Methylacidiphilales bacterium]|nr:hypothetical protein [Candidatus Methylacidiphilales bacterium]
MNALQFHRHLRKLVAITLAALTVLATVVIISPDANAADPATPKKKARGSASAHASERTGNGIVRIISPDTEQTFAQFEIVSQRLYWSRHSQQLTADITFSNLLYSSRNLRREDELYNFRLPGAVLDPATGLITARASNGNRVVIARYVKQVLGGSIRFAPYAYVTIFNNHGRVSVELVANSGGAPVDLHWQVRGRELRFRNLLD